ncbi:ATP-binding protein [Streptomyces sp. DSM 41014]|uniref:ATP-binding protein n=1 Tax=Streptomyces hintoniae TaxID=3075521 RepID=A0ABU2UCF7_9ACTN|nr:MULTISPECIES: ATP-binding protein [unclassified Streptomyces]MDH6699983.1 anti-sigma regulatory factor (Ser/Thr protein kinase) [Streptomyces sp. MAA16]MDT0470933.1 ATP-binding protein [Streptomyces sp. DSM 41014]
MPATETFRIPRHRRHVPTARHHVLKALADWGVSGELVDCVVLLANELVTNAVTHCRVTHAQVKVTLTLEGRDLLLEVSDPDRDRLPLPHHSTPDEEGGRGLALVEALADEWGHRQDPFTKCVWARFRLPGSEGDDVPPGA